MAAAGEPGGVDSIVLTGTSKKSALRIRVTQGPAGDGLVHVGKIEATGVVGKIAAPAVVLAGADFSGGVRRVELREIVAGAEVKLGSGGGSTKLTVDAIGAATIEAAGKIAALKAASIAGAAIEAAAVGTVQVQGGFDALVSVAGRIASLEVRGGDLSGRIHAQSIGPMSVRTVNGAGGSIVDATIAASQTIGSLIVDRDIIDSLILAGADLGIDLALGGAGADADTFGAGRIGRIKVRGAVRRSILGAGLSPGDAIFGDDNDGIVGGKASRILKLSLGSLSGDSLIGATLFKKGIKIGGAKLKMPQIDARFVTRKLTGAPPPPPPEPQPLDPTTSTNLADATSFLYTGANAIQTGVAPGTIQAKRAGVLRGQVRNRGGGALGGVTISVLDHPEFGETRSQADGSFDMAVNGGGLLVVKFEKDGFCPAQRQVNAALQDYSIVADVVLVTPDPAVTAVDFGATAPMQIHEATMQSDADGERHAMLMFQPGTSASLVMEDGSLEPMPFAQNPRHGIHRRPRRPGRDARGPAAHQRLYLLRRSFRR